MKSNSVQKLRIPSLVLAAALQTFPILRAALPAAETATNVLAIIFRWTAGAAVALGGVQAVSGASTLITNPLNVDATEGQPFSLRLTTGPDQAHYWTATGLPAGLSLSGVSGQVLWQIIGTPTVSGTYDVGLTAKDQATSGTSRTVTATLVLNIAPAALTPPAISSQPTNQSVYQGQHATFTVTATGTAPLSYQWRFQGANLVGQTSSTLTLNAVTPTNAGNYDAIISNGYGSVTSTVATLTINAVPTAPTITTQPASQTVVAGQSATFTVWATGAAPLNYQWRFLGSNLTAQTSSTLTLNSVTPTNAGNYDVLISNGYGSVTSAVATLTVSVPTGAPGITNQPGSLIVLQGQNATFTVGATGAAPLSYQWRFQGANLTGQGSGGGGGGGDDDSSGTTVNYAGQTSPTLVLTAVTTANAGSYDVIVSNGSGSVTSQVATLTVLTGTSGTAPLTVIVNGAGTVSPNYNGQMLTIGGSYSMTASPAAGYSFAGWSGDLNATSRTLTFVMRSNLLLQANFVPNSSPSPSGSYSGLFYETNGVSYLSSGFIAVKTTASGNYSATLMFLGRRHAFHGRLDAVGLATNLISRGVVNPLTVVLQLNTNNLDQLGGLVTDGSWTAALRANRVVFDKKSNPAPQTGSYTLVIPGTPGVTASPAGDGVCTVTVNAEGRVRLQGVLADGSRISQSSTLSKSGEWPLYAPLHSKEGALLGWLTFTNRADDDINGVVSWIKEQQPADKYFPIGFAVETDAVGSRYVRPVPGTPVLDFSTGQVLLAGGGLAQSLSNSILLEAGGKVSTPVGSGLRLSIKKSSGLFKGSFTDPATGRRIGFKGVLLQKQNLGDGFFLNQGRSGSVYFGPQ